MLQNNVDFLRWLQAVMNDFSLMCVFGRLVFEPPVAKGVDIGFTATSVMIMTAIVVVNMRSTSALFWNVCGMIS